MDNEENVEYVNKCREKLVAIGFEMVQHTGLFATPDGVNIIDFSAINPDKYFHYGMQKMFMLGYEQGMRDVKSNIEKALKGI